jgi:internalin A
MFVRFKIFWARLEGSDTLDLSENRLTALPSSIGNLTNLIRLDLKVNQLKKSPSSIGNLTKLTHLDLYDNQLKELPTQIGNLTNLTYLGLARNQLKELPSSIGNLTNLTYLDLYDNQLKELPSFIGNLTNLTELNLDGNQLKELPSSIGNLTNLNRLNLGENQFKELPSSIGNLTNLTYLYLCSNQLKELPSSIGNLTNLTEIDLRKNQFKQFPKVLLDLNLEIVWKDSSSNDGINVYGNPFEVPPVEIVKKGKQVIIEYFKALGEINLENNQLTILPSEITEMKYLERLNLCHNQLTQLPSNIKNLQNLTGLWLHNNQLYELPTEISTLKNLKELDLSKNQFKHFPKSLLDLNLDIVWSYDLFVKGIRVIDNPFEIPPINIVKQGKEAIIEYFKTSNETNQLDESEITIIQPINITPVEIPQTIIQETRISNIPKPLNEAKLILIGDGGAGKTSLMKLLRGETFNPQESQTHGINIQQLNFSFNNNEIKLNYWDFGGQQIMHATHQFFLSKRSLYVLVVDSRRESHVDYWLKHIQTFAENAPVIIVLNKIDENPHFDVLRRQLKQNYPNIKAFCRLSCATNEGIDDLKNTIQTVLPNIELLNTLFPRRWFEVKNAIAAQAIHKNFTSYDHYIDICQQYKIFEESEQHTLINFLHDLGLVIHFSDAWLRETNVINPQWLTEAIYTIINAPSLANHGKLLKNQLTNLLNTQVYPSHKHDYLLELMKKFELCFSLDQQTFLLPDLFPAHEPDFDFDFQHAIHFILEYDFLPKSIFTRLIVRMHHAIKNNYYWRNGVVLFDPTYQTTAFIETNQQQLKLHLQGNKAREYLTVLQFVLNDIHQSFSHLKITHKIGLPDHPEITVSYEYLLKLLENKQTNYVPQELPTKSYKINELLGIFSIEKWSDDQIAQMLTSMNQVLENIGLKQEELLSRGEEIFEIKPELMGVSVDLKALWRKFKRNN